MNKKNMYLAHYGRKGMKWGKHIFDDSDAQDLRSDIIDRYSKRAQNETARPLTTKEFGDNMASRALDDYQNGQRSNSVMSILSNEKRRVANNKRVERWIKTLSLNHPLQKHVRNTPAADGMYFDRDDRYEWYRFRNR